MSALERWVCYVCVVVVFDASASQAFGYVPPGRFVDAKPVPGLASPWADEEPALTPDELTIVFSSDRPPGPQVDSNVDLYIATRRTVADSFGEPVKLNMSVDGVSDNAPWMSEDALSLYYSSGGDIVMSTRESVLGDWRAPISLESINSSATDFAPFLSADELMIYLNSNRNGSHDLFQFTRRSTMEPFGPAEPLAGVNTPGKGEYQPSVSSDGLVLFYASNTLTSNNWSQLWVAERSSTDQPFANPVVLEEFSLGHPASLGGARAGARSSPFVSSSWPGFGARIYFVHSNDLTGADNDIWQATWLPGWDFTERNLAGVSFADSNLENVDFSRANLAGAFLGGAMLEGAVLNDAVVTGADFERTTLTGFTKEQLYSTAGYKAKDLREIRLGRNDLSGWRFEGQNLSRAYLHGATLAGADFRDAVVAGTDFEGTTIRGFTKEQLYSTVSYNTKNLEGIRLGNNDLSEWDFRGQNLARAYLRRATLIGSDLSGVNLANSDLASARLADANLADANVSNASFQRVGDLGSAVFSADTLYNQWTVFPSGFDPADHGLTFFSSEAGDLDGHAGLTVTDLDLLTTRIQDDSFISWQFAMFDLDGSSAINREDLRFWVEDLKQTAMGDADLDGRVDFPDFVALANSFGGPGGWGQGDFNGTPDMGVNLWGASPLYENGN